MLKIIGTNEELRALVDEMVASTRKEDGTLDYEWSTCVDGRACHLYERHADSAATMVHLAGFESKFASRFLKILQPVRLTVYGMPNKEVKNALAAFNPVYMEAVGGFSR
jgi:quinol monooxygenase YgiN